MRLRESLHRFFFGKGWSSGNWEQFVSSWQSQIGVQGGYAGLPAPFVEDSYTRLIDVYSGDADTAQSYKVLRDLCMSNPFGSACIRKIAESVSAIEWEAYKIRGDGTRVVDPKHPVFRLLAGRLENRSRLSFVEPIVQHLHFGGELFVYMPVARSEGSMRPLSMDLVSPEKFAGFLFKGRNEPRGFRSSISDRTYRMIPAGGIVGYKFRNVAGENQLAELVMGHLQEQSMMFASVDQMFHVKRYNSRNELRGLPLAWGARIPLVQAYMAAKWNTNLSKTGGRVVGFFTPAGLKPGTQITEEQMERLQKDMDYRMLDRQNQNRPMVLSGAMEYHSNTVTPREADFLHNDKFNARKICTALKVPPILVGDVESVGLGGGSGLKGAERLFFLNGVLPFLDDLLDEFNTSVMKRFPGGYRLGYNRANVEPIQEDLEKLWKRASTGCGGAFASVNDSRAAVGLEKLPDPEYDEVRSGMNEERDPMAEEEDNEDRNDRERQDDNTNLRILRA